MAGAHPEAAARFVADDERLHWHDQAVWWIRQKRDTASGRPSVELTAVADPHTLADLDLAILPGELGVAENAAVWVEGRALHHRAVFVIANHLALVVRARDIVHHMHEAYERLAGRPRGYGLFISGPSKTADIEQVLVVGAQGARTCTVLVIDGPAG